MSLNALVFVNVSRKDAFLSVQEGNGDAQFVAALAPGNVVKHMSASGQTWSVVGNDSYQITASDQNRVYLIGASGVYEVENARALVAESGAKSNNFAFPGAGAGGWP